MIKLSRWLYLHPLTVLLAVFCYINRTLEFFAMAFLIMTVHELSHLLAAVCIGLRPARIVFYPFGVNLKLKNTLVYSISDEIILYLAGPLSNLLLALVCVVLFRDIAGWERFYLQNLLLFGMNMLPILPLDGGVIVKKILAHRLGTKTAQRLMQGVSAVLIAGLCVFGGYLIYQNRFHASITFLVVFLLGNIFCSREKYQIDFVKELMFYKEKGQRYNHQTVKTMLMKKGSDCRKVAEHFTTGSYYVVFCVDEKGRIDELLTETQIMERILG